MPFHPRPPADGVFQSTPEISSFGNTKANALDGDNDMFNYPTP